MENKKRVVGLYGKKLKINEISNTINFILHKVGFEPNELIKDGLLRPARLTASLSVLCY